MRRPGARVCRLDIGSRVGGHAEVDPRSAGEDMHLDWIGGIGIQAHPATRKPVGVRPTSSSEP